MDDDIRQHGPSAARNLFWLFAISGSVAVFSLLTRIKLANLLGPRTFGLYSYGLAIAIYGTVIVRYGRDRLMVRSLVQHPEKTNQTIGATVLLTSALMAVVVPVFGFYIYCCEPELGLSGLLIILCSCAGSLDLQPVYDSWRRMGRHATYGAVDRFLFMGVIWAVVLCFPRYVNLPIIAAASLVGIVASLYLQYREVRRATGFRVIQREVFKEAVWLLGNSFPIALATFAATAFAPTTNVFLKHYCSLAEVGIYAAAWQLAMITRFGLNQIGRIGNPAMARIARPNVSLAERRIAVGRYALVMLVAAAPVAVPCFVCPALVVNTCFGPEYAPVVRILPLFGAYVLLLSVGIVASQCVISMGRDRLYLTSVITGGGIGIVLAFLLIPRHGAVGAAWSLVTSHGSAMLLYISTTIRLLASTSYEGGACDEIALPQEIHQATEPRRTAA